MLNISDNDYDFLKKHIKDLDVYLNNKSVNPLLTKIDEVILYKGFDKDYFYNDFGKKAQEVYDSLYDNNEY